MRAFAIGLFLLLIFAAGLVFGHANTATVTFDYVFGAVDAPLISLLVITLVTGVVLTFLVCYGRMFRLRRELRRTQRRLRDAEEELKNLRTLPVAQPPQS
jgi:uncharacterized integral membrane protein